MVDMTSHFPGEGAARVDVPRPCEVAVVGGGPAGLMAAEVLSARGVQVDLYDAMPSVGRKFLLAGRGGLNLTHSEPFEAFVTRFGAAQGHLQEALCAFTPTLVREWAAGLGIDTFVGTSGRVFPTDMKAAPLLRAWLHRLRAQGVRFHMRHQWVGWADERHRTLRFQSLIGPVDVQPAHTLLALGGASWPRLGSNGAWVPVLTQLGLSVAPLRPANCGFDVAGPQGEGWSPFMRERFAGQPVKPVALTFTDATGHTARKQGEFVLTEHGVEGSLIYAFASAIRDTIAVQGQATVHLDLLPDWPLERVLAEVTRPRGPRSLSTHLKSRLGLQGLKAALLHETLAATQLADAPTLAQAIKALPLSLARARPVAEAISTAGGVRFDALDGHGAARAHPHLSLTGEMLDWEAPTGGYLLTACLALGRDAAMGILERLRTPV